MNKHLPQKERITPEKAMEVLKRNGIDVNRNQAREILDLMYLLAKIAIDGNVVEKKC